MFVHSSLASDTIRHETETESMLWTNFCSGCDWKSSLMMQYIVEIEFMCAGFSRPFPIFPFWTINWMFLQPVENHFKPNDINFKFDKSWITLLIFSYVCIYKCFLHFMCKYLHYCCFSLFLFWFCYSTKKEMKKKKLFPQMKSQSLNTIYRYLFRFVCKNFNSIDTCVRIHR